MPNESAEVAGNKLSNETWWAVMGYKIADAVIDGQPVDLLLVQARERRALEYRNIEMETRFASLVRQLADAFTKARDTRPLLQQLVSLRRQQLGPALTESEALDLRDRIKGHRRTG